jgi:hypothetical protein
VCSLCPCAPLILVAVCWNRLQTRVTSTTKSIRSQKGADLACALAYFRPASRTGIEWHEILSGSHATIRKCCALNLFQSTLPPAGGIKRCKSVNTFRSWDRGGNSTVIVEMVRAPLTRACLWGTSQSSCRRAFWTLRTVAQILHQNISRPYKICLSVPLRSISPDRAALRCLCQ